MADLHKIPPAFPVAICSVQEPIKGRGPLPHPASALAAHGKARALVLGRYAETYLVLGRYAETYLLLGRYAETYLVLEGMLRLI